jgi:hypothetical protein
MAGRAPGRTAARAPGLRRGRLYFHVVFTLPGAIADIAYQNKAVVYDLLLKTAAETLITIAADPKHLGAHIGLTAVLHTWGSALTHHPHAHIIVPGGGFSPDGRHWIPCRPGFFLPVRVLSRLFRRLFLEKLTTAFEAGHLEFFGDHAALAEPTAFKAYLDPLRQTEWVVYSKRPFGGPDAVLAYLSRYTHRVAISNSRLIAFDGERVSFRWKDYRAKGDVRYKVMTLDADEFIHRFLIHVLPDGFHRIRHYGLFANANRAANIALARQLLGMPAAPSSSESDSAEAGHADEEWNACPCCGGRMVIVGPSSPAASPGSGLSHQSGSTAHDRHAPVAIPHHCACPRPRSHRQWPCRADHNRQRRLRAPKTQITQRTIAAPIAPAVLKTTVIAPAHPPFPFEIEKSE